MTAKELIASGKAVLGIEFGSTRIKAVLVGEDNAPMASGSYDWENKLENGIVEDDLFHFALREIEKKKDEERSKIEALEKDEFQFAEFPEYINKIKKYL